MVPLEKRDKIVKAWYVAKKNGIGQEEFCNQLNISTRVLRVWTSCHADPKISIKKIDSFLDALSKAIIDAKTLNNLDAIHNSILDAKSQLSNLTEDEALTLPLGHLESLLPNRKPLVATPVKAKDITITSKPPTPKPIETVVESLPIVIPNVPVAWDFD